MNYKEPEIKYYMSGLKLLAEMAYMKPGNREKILGSWFAEKEEDPLKNDLKKITGSGIMQDMDVRFIVQSMIGTVPEEERYRPDSKGYTFLPRDPEKTVERIYSEAEGKYKLCAVYEGLYPGVDEFGISFADLRYEYRALGKIKDLEEEFQTGSLKAWELTLASVSDEDLSILSTGSSGAGRYQLLAGIPRERIPHIVMHTILYGPGVHADADSVADRLLNEWLRLMKIA